MVCQLLLLTCKSTSQHYVGEKWGESESLYWLSKTLLQGISFWNWLFKLALRDRRTKIIFGLWCLAASGGADICVSSTSFQKNGIGWPQQPPTEKVPKLNLKFHDSTQNSFFQNIKIKVNSNPWMTLKSSVVIFPGLKTSGASMTSVASTASMASMTSTASFHQKIYWSWWFDHP